MTKKKQKETKSSVALQHSKDLIDSKLSRQIKQLEMLYERGDKELVLKLSQQMVAAFPNSVQLLSLCAIVNEELGHLDNAIDLYEKIIEQNPRILLAHQYLGSIFLKQERFGDALRAYVAEKKLQPTKIDLDHKIAAILNRIGNHVEALNVAKKSLSVLSENYKLENEMGLALLAQRHFNEAEKVFRKALSKQPNNPMLINNLAISLKKRGLFEDATQVIQQALLIDPNNPTLYNNLGRIFMDQGKLEKAKKAYKQALSFEPDNPLFNYNLSQPNLMQYNFNIGFKHFEWRWRAHNNIGESLISAKPKWSGQKNKRLFVWAEQGIGDEIMFSSIIKSAYDISSQLIVSCDERLMTLFKRSFPKDIIFKSRGKHVDAALYDYHIAMGSLPKILRLRRSSFKSSAMGYLKSDPSKTKLVKDNLIDGKQNKVIGLSWFSKSSREDADERNIQLEELLCAIRKPNFRFVSLQYGDVLPDISRLKNKTGIVVSNEPELDRFNDIDGLASLIQACDHVVTIDNSTAHLAGALGVSTYLLLPLTTDWRWGKFGFSSYWYRSVRILRQTVQGDWSHVLKNLSLPDL